MSGQPLRPGDIADKWMVEVYPDRGDREGFVAVFFWNQKQREVYDGEGWGATLDEAVRAAVQDAEEHEGEE